MRLLLTGAGGFIGSHVLEHILTETDWQVTATDSFRHKGRTDRIAEVLAPHPEWAARMDLVVHDLAAPFTAPTLDRMGAVGYVIAMASESHVDRSIADPAPFVRNNVNVILSTLEAARYLRPRAVIVISTDEVYGPVERGGAGHPEWAPVIPSNPYSASKAAQEAIAISYWRTYGVPVTIVNVMNAFAERQDPEKFLPLLIRGISGGGTVPIHGRPGDIGSRHYIHARNIADALLFILRELPPAVFAAETGAGRYAAEIPVPAVPGTWKTGPPADRPDRYNIAGPEPVSNLDLAQEVARIIGQPLRYELVDFHSARPGHDPHYGLDMAKLTAAGWKAPVGFAESLERTVRWTLAHPEWLL